MSAQLTKVVSGLIFFGSVFLTACAKDVTILRRVPSPNGKGSATVVMDGPYLFHNQTIRMEVLYDGKRHVVFETEPRADMVDCFVAVGWSKDSTLAGFFVRPCYASPMLKGYDFKKESPAPETAVEDLLRNTIQADFDFTPKTYDDPYIPHAMFISDPLVWAKRTYDATARYARKYKDGRVTVSP